MNLILRPVNTKDRNPKEEGPYFTDLGVLCFNKSTYNNYWADNNSHKSPKIWYEPIQIESLFPDDDKATFLAENATNGNLNNMSFHIEGQSSFKNYLLKELKK